MPNFQKRKRSEPGPAPGRQPPHGSLPDFEDWPEGPPDQMGPRRQLNQPPPHSLQDQRGLRTGTTSPNRGYRAPETQPRQEHGSPRNYGSAKVSGVTGGGRGDRGHVTAPEAITDQGPWAVEGGRAPRGIRTRK